MSYLAKTREQLLSEALQKLQKNTDINATSPGSVARAMTEVVTAALGDYYNVLDFNMSRSVISTAQGRALDLIGSLFSTPRKDITDTVAIDKSLGVFYFYLDAPYNADVTIPIGTKVYTDIDTYVGQQHAYATTELIVIGAGRTRAYASIRPTFSDGVFTAGPGTLTVLDPNYVQPIGTTVRATNPKSVQAQVGVEDDENYRTRIIKAVRVAAGGTLDALRFAALGVSGVRDVSLRDTPYGLGSVEALIITEDNLINGTAMRQASLTLDKVRAAGVRLYVRQPDLLPFSVIASIVIRDGASVNRDNIARRAEVAIIRYLNTMLVGTTLVYSQLLQQILDSSDVVIDVVISSYSANGTEVLRRNYTPQDDQQIIPGQVSVSPA